MPNPKRASNPSFGLRESHIRGMICQAPALEECVEAEETSGDCFWTGRLVAPGRVARPTAKAAHDPGKPSQTC